MFIAQREVITQQFPNILTRRRTDKLEDFQLLYATAATQVTGLQ